jgi:aspartate carbamoyltransferase regulatory subunit
MTDYKEQNMISKEMKVSKLRNGAVIDHLAPGMAMKAIEFLGVRDDSTLAIGMFFESKKMGRKDILKFENRELTRDEINKIAVLSPEATVCIIKDYNVVDKFSASLPREIEGIIRCSNPKCITNNEKIATRFVVQEKDPLIVRCQYCERAMHGSEIEFV